MGRAIGDVKFEIALNIGGDGAFANAAVDGEGREAIAVAAADAVQIVEERHHFFEVEGVELLDHRRVAGARNALELVGDAGQREQVIGHLLLGGGTRPSVVLDIAIGRTHLVLDIGHAEIEAVEDRVIEIIAAAQLCFVDAILEIGVAERIAGRLDIAGVQRVDTVMHGDGNDRQVLGIIDRLAGDAENGGADRGASAIGIVRAGLRSRMMRVQFQSQAAGAIPGDIATQRLVFGPVFGQRSRIGQVLAFIDAEAFGVEVRTRDRTVGPAARHIVEVEPDADVGIAHLNGVA